MAFPQENLELAILFNRLNAFIKFNSHFSYKSENPKKKSKKKGIVFPKKFFVKAVVF